MKKIIFSLTFIIYFISLPDHIYSQKRPPTIFVDKGACPFECCTYRQWKTEKTTIAYSQPNQNSKRVGKFLAGTKVRALTGEVRTVGGQFEVKEPHGKYKPGDVIWVYTYFGEGLFKIWFKGKWAEEDLEFSPYGGSMGKRCEVPNQCWGELKKELQSTWWVKIKSAKGWIGWTNQAQNFSGADLCG